MAAVKAARARLRVDPATATGRAVQALQQVRAIGAGGAWVLATEIFGWREIRNGRELGALVGLAPALYPEWGDAARSRDYAGGQCACAAHDGATGVGLAAVATR